jgi:hypothetical protein
VRKERKSSCHPSRTPPCLSSVLNPLYLVVVLSAEKYWNEREPDDASAVHGESNVFGLVEVLRDLSRFERVPRAEEDKDHVVHEADEDAETAHTAR